MSSNKPKKSTAAKTAKSQTADETAKVSRRAQRKMEESNARKRRLMYIIGAIALSIVVIGFGLWIRDRNQDDPLPAIVAATDPAITAPINGRIAGDSSTAKVEFVEWGDYQ